MWRGRSAPPTSRKLHAGGAPLLAASAVFVALLSGTGVARGESSGGNTTTVDRIVAVVEGSGARGEEAEIITLFELVVEARLVRAERQGSVEEAMSGLSEALLDAVLRTAIDQLLIRKEATRLGVVTISRASTERERQAMELRLGGAEALATLLQVTGAPEDLIEAIATRRAMVNDFVARSVTLSVRLSDAEVAAGYRAGGHPFEGRPLDEVREQLEAHLTAERRRELLEEWLSDLRDRARVRVLTD